MKTVSATEAKQRFAAVIDAAQREPVVIRRQNRDVAVVMSPTDFDRIRGVQNAEIKRLLDVIGKKATSRGMTEKALALMLKD